MYEIISYFNKNSGRELVNFMIENMNSLQKHRGPDISGKFINKEKKFFDFTWAVKDSNSQPTDPKSVALSN